MQDATAGIGHHADALTKESGPPVCVGHAHPGATSVGCRWSGGAQDLAIGTRGGDDQVALAKRIGETASGDTDEFVPLISRLG